MDSKWCRSYERAALYGEKLEILDYSPEIDTYLKVTCFPTFPGHCGCILFDTSEIEFVKKNVDMIVANSLRTAGAGFGTDTNIVTVITKDGAEELALMSKDQVAHELLNRIFAGKH